MYKEKTQNISYIETSKEKPQNIEAEMYVLGCLLYDNKSFIKIINVLKNTDFYYNKHNIIFQAITNVFNNGDEINILTVKDYLETKKQLNLIGGATYLTGLLNKILTSSSILSFANKIKDTSIKRQLLQANHENETIIYDDEKNIDNILAEVQENIFKINKIDLTDNSSKEAVKELEKTQQEYSTKLEAGKKYIGTSVGFEKIDKVIDGLRPGHVWAIGAFSSTGKTQFSLNIVHSVLEQEVPTSFISLEMSRVDLMARLIGIRNKISSSSILKGLSNHNTREKIEEGKDFLKQAPLYIHNSSFELDKIKMEIRRDFYLHGVKFFVLDYIQNIISYTRMSEYELITKSAIELQSLARELGVTIAIISQISNEAEKGNAAGSGFKGSGALEAVADIAIRLKRNKEEEQADDEYVPVDIHINKNRHGYTGKIDDYFMHLKSGKFIKKNTIPEEEFTLYK